MKVLALGLALILFGSYQGASAAANNNLAAMPIRNGDNPLELMRKNGFTGPQCSEILRKAPGLGSVELTTDLFYLRENANRRVTLRIHDQATDKAYRITREGSKTEAEAYVPRMAVVIAKIEGVVHGSLIESIKRSVPSNWVASRFIDAFRMEHKLNTLPAGAKFSLRYEKKYEDGKFVKYGEVLDAALDMPGLKLQRNFVRVADGGVFVNKEDLSSGKPLYAPVNYLRVASEFQRNRRHPVTHRIQPHLGIDFEVPAGSPVMAAKSGVVARFGHGKAAGNFLVLSHGPGLETAYDHLRKIEPGLKKGTSVKVGQKIAEVGCTGYCTKPHLHFAVKLRGQMVNPAPMLKAYPWDFEASLNKVAAE